MTAREVTGSDKFWVSRQWPWWYALCHPRTAAWMGEAQLLEVRIFKTINLKSLGGKELGINSILLQIT